MEDNKGFLFYESFYKALNNLDNECAGAVIKALGAYQFEGIESDFDDLIEDDPENAFYKRLKVQICKVSFELMKPNIDASTKRYEANRKNGAKGGRPKNENPNKPMGYESENPNKPMGFENKTQENPSVFENKTLEKDIEKEKEKEKEKEIEIEKEIFVEKEEEKESGMRDGTTSLPDDSFQIPTVDEVKDYAWTIGMPNFDAEYFIDYYTSVGWMQNGNPIVNWQAKVKAWKKNERNMNSKKSSAKKIEAPDFMIKQEQGTLEKSTEPASQSLIEELRARQMRMKG